MSAKTARKLITFGAHGLFGRAALLSTLLCSLDCTEPAYDNDVGEIRAPDAGGTDPFDGSVPATSAGDAARDMSSAQRELDAAPPDGTGEHDTSVPAPAANGDAAVEDAALAPAETRLLGSYLARSYGFWIDDGGGKMTVDELALADFEQVGDHVELRMRVCRQSSRTAGFSLDLLSAASFPELRRVVSVTEAGFSTDDHPIATGYERDGIAACAGKPGQSIPVQPEQSWLTGSCRCPTSSAEPPTLDDCRVIDPDHDGAPALSYRLTGLGVTTHLASVVRSHHVRGVSVGAADMFAEMQVDEIGYYISCMGLNCFDSDRFGRPCASAHNGTQFVSLAARGSGALSCEQALAREAEFFPTALPAQPASCVRDVLTDDPTRP